MIKDTLKDVLIKSVNFLGLSSEIIGTPNKNNTVKEWCARNAAKLGVAYKLITPEKQVHEKPPVSFDGFVPSLFSDEYQRLQTEAFVATIPNARVWGCWGAVISPDDYLLYDVSREFGRYGGVFGEEHSINKNIKLHKIKFIAGNVAVLSTAGCNNYHHWMYDVLPRVQLLKAAGVFDSMDYFIIDHNKLPYQAESLQQLGIPETKIMYSIDNWRFHIKAAKLFIPALPARWGTVNGWTIDFLRKTFLTPGRVKANGKIKLYLSRRKAPSRKLVNEAAVLKQLEALGFREFFAEDFSIKETAEIFSSCSAVVGVHGSGFANLAFCQPGTKVIDILAPNHYDGYYWIISNYNQLSYAMIFGKGELPQPATDLVRHKVNEDIDIDTAELLSLYHRINEMPC